MRRICMMAILWASFSLPIAAVGHEAVSINGECAPPTRPEDEHNEQEWQAFLEDVKAFRHCVSDAMQWHELAATRHNEHARQEVERWNDFVRSSLNAPEDFPWPE